MTETPDNVREIEVAPHHYNAFLDKIEKANRKAARNGLPVAYTWTVTLKERTVPNAEFGGLPKIESYYLFTVTVHAPKIAGWTFVATLTWDTEVGLVTRVVPGLTEEPDLSSLRVEGTHPWCDHCNTARNRIDTFALRNDATGEIKQVGRNCLQAFLGITVGLWIADPANDLDSETLGGWLGGGEYRYTLENLLVVGLAITEVDGGEFVSRARVRAYEGAY